MTVEKIFCNESQKSLNSQLLLEVSLCRFQFVFARRCLHCCYYEYIYTNLVSRPNSPMEGDKGDEGLKLKPLFLLKIKITLPKLPKQGI